MDFPSDTRAEGNHVGPPSLGACDHRFSSSIPAPLAHEDDLQREDDISTRLLIGTRKSPTRAVDPVRRTLDALSRRLCTRVPTRKVVKKKVFTRVCMLLHVTRYFLYVHADSLRRDRKRGFDVAHPSKSSLLTFYIYTQNFCLSHVFICMYARACGMCTCVCVFVLFKFQAASKDEDRVRGPRSRE